MARRKIRPLGVIAFCTVLLLFQLLRKGGKEVFTFDTLPEYTDTEGYVKKPVPQGVQVSLPPPPPADWTTPGGLHVVDEDRLARGNEPKVRPRPPPVQPPRQNPARPAQQRPNEDSEERTAFADVHSTDSLHDAVDPIANDEKQPLATSPSTGEQVHVPDQPPVSGDVHAGTRHSTRPLYTQEDLAPRIEKYPISPNDIIRLPKLKPVTMPKVQARYPSESADHKRIRLQRQAAIKRAMTRSWETYSTYAMGHDEVRPVSADHHDPFCGWGATLVDSLDTLQIMGMQTEYEEALKFVETIDFAHTPSHSIPLFETVIRYLGGLLGAFDMSNGRDTILLDKAKELGDMLMGSFDTINRMPLLRYSWRPRAARHNLRAGEDSCLAELGTLTMEFTRLAQLTGNHSYFDAVQRITDGFSGFQYSHIPGLFPLHIDASGCRHGGLQDQGEAVTTPPAPASHYGGTTGEARNRPPSHQKRQVIEHEHEQEESHLEDPGRANMGNAMRESLSEQTALPAGQPDTSWADRAAQEAAKCNRKGLTPSVWRSTQEFSFGGEADSVYEYFIKEHLLLGGARDQYRKLYVDSIEAAEKYLFYRPLVEGDPDILFSGKYHSYYAGDGTANPADGQLFGDMQHLTCFVGGMLGLGSKILNRPHDLMLAEKITDGCVWAYNITASGVMGESFTVDICDEEPCHWTPPETLHKSLHLVGIDDDQDLTADRSGLETQTSTHVKRQSEPADPPRAQEQSRQGPPLPEAPHNDQGEVIEPAQRNTGTVNPEVEQIALDRQHATHFVQAAQQPESFHHGMDTRYILRPEAIESVFYMWRITGDPVWQDKGWQMWEAIERVSWTELAYSAIENVNIPDSPQADSMESFWLAETLKYFYLLYSDPSLISLDEWVFNTEAHPFRRPNPGAR